MATYHPTMIHHSRSFEDTAWLAGYGEGVDQAGDGRVGGDRLTPQHGDIREAVPAQRDRQSEVQEDLAGIVDGPRLPPRSQSCGYRLVKARFADRLQQQDCRPARPPADRVPGHGHVGTTR